jgi:acyl-CoA thioester hydrolase
MTDAYRHRTRVEVRFRDIDAFGHVNNAVTASFVEQARVSYLHDVLGFDPVGRMPMILAMVRIDYAAPIFWGELVDIGSRVDWVGRSSMAMSHRLSGGSDEHDMAAATSVLVAYDYGTAQPMPIPDVWRAALTAHEGHALERPAVVR